MATLAGFAPGEQITATLYSDPVLLRVLTADANGEVTVTLTIPSSTAVGAHEIDFVGVMSARAAHAAITVTGSATLASTGVTVQGQALLGAVLLLLGLAVTAFGRRLHGSARRAH